MTQSLFSDHDPLPQWRGLHHIALLTVNLADTRDF